MPLSLRATSFLRRHLLPPNPTQSLSRPILSLRHTQTPARLLYTTPSHPADPSALAAEFLSRFPANQPKTSTRLLDANQLRLFSITLSRDRLFPNHRSLSSSPPNPGTPLPALYHLAYFTPALLPSRLPPDGTDPSFNPAPPFTRRMWAGGALEWPGVPKGVFLRVGDEVTEETKVLSCEPKVIRKTGESMLVVSVEKTFRTPSGDVAVVDHRNWIFRAALSPNTPSRIPRKPPVRPSEELEKMSNGCHVQSFPGGRSEVDLFRFSALTFNAHRIHYDREWARNVEGHRGVVVHGPLSLVAMGDLWRDGMVAEGLQAGEGEGVWMKRIEYRATSPLYAGEGYRILVEKSGSEEGGRWGRREASVLSDDGTVCMKGFIEGW